ncbi:MAG: hypothetical protein COA78_27700 [Blastopirellula sp.]|nr:MAG: hypothetical protein COA78_27700 [Blastopirellula sp.]
MNITGSDELTEATTTGLVDWEMVFNERGAIIFDGRFQHSDTGSPGIAYKDNYAGNALAAMLRMGSIEIRFHKNFSDARVTEIMNSIQATDALNSLGACDVIYQGRKLFTMMVG